MDKENLDIRELGSLIIGGSITDVIPNWCGIDIVFMSKYYLELIDGDCVQGLNNVEMSKSELFYKLITSVGKTITLVRYKPETLLDIVFEDGSEIELPSMAYIAFEK